MNTNASILVYKFRPERTGFNMYAEYTGPQLTFLAFHPGRKLWGNKIITYIRFARHGSGRALKKTIWNFEKYECMKV